MNRIILILLSVALSSMGCSEYAKLPKEQYSINGNNYIRQVKKNLVNKEVRAGYVYYYNSPDLISKMKMIGVNTVIVKCWKFENPIETQKTVDRIKSWARVAKQENISLILAINWHPYPFMKELNLDRVAFRDGNKAEGVNPLDDDLWSKHIDPLVMGISKMSTNPESPIAAILFDTEIYSEERVDEKKRNYPRFETGYNSEVMEGFLRLPDVKSKGITEVDVINNKKLQVQFDNHISKLLRKKFTTLRKRVAQVNPYMLFGIYMHPDLNDWMRTSLSQGLSTRTNPILIFGIHSYGYFKNDQGESWQYIPEGIENTYKEAGIECRYFAGFLPRKFTSTELSHNLINSKKRARGYWVFRIHDFWTKKDNKLLYDIEYRSAVKSYLSQ